MGFTAVLVLLCTMKLHNTISATKSSKPSSCDVPNPRGSVMCWDFHWGNRACDRCLCFCRLYSAGTKGPGECDVPTTSEMDNEPTLRNRKAQCMSDRHQLIKTQNVFGPSPHVLLSTSMPWWRAAQCRPLQRRPWNTEPHGSYLDCCLATFPSERPATRSSFSSPLTLSDVKTTFGMQVGGAEVVLGQTGNLEMAAWISIIK